MQAIILTGCNYCRAARLALFAGLHFNQRASGVWEARGGSAPNMVFVQEGQGLSGGAMEAAPGLEKSKGLFAGP